MAHASRIYCLLGICFLLLWQGSFYLWRNQLPSTYPTRELVGLHQAFHQFAYFYHYFGVFPVASREDGLPPGKVAASEYVAKHGKQLVMDRQTGAGKFGDYAKVFFFYPEVWLRSNPEGATVKTAMALLFVGALIGLWIAFCLQGHFLLGAATAFIVGSHPFQLVQVYRLDNIFSLPITVALILLAMNLHLCWSPPFLAKRDFWVAFISGAVCSFFSAARGDVGALLVSLVFLYALRTRVSSKHKLMTLGFLAIGFFGSGFAVEKYFEKKFYSAKDFVTQNGGHPYYGPHLLRHPFWHPAYIGLGDFDSKYGIRWDDKINYEYATPILREKFGLDLHWKQGKYYFEESYDPEGWYLKQPEDFWQYESTIRDRYWTQVMSDPLWWCTIVAKRIGRVFTEAVPPSLSLGAWGIHFPGSGWAITAILIGLWIYTGMQSWAARIFLFTLPLSIPALVVYSGGGMTYFSIFPALSLALSFELTRLSLRGAPSLRGTKRRPVRRSSGEGGSNPFSFSLGHSKRSTK